MYVQGSSQKNILEVVWSINTYYVIKYEIIKKLFYLILFQEKMLRGGLYPNPLQLWI
jgi:hypothetical protein